jgi:hypothetical protein
VEIDAPTERRNYFVRNLTLAANFTGSNLVCDEAPFCVPHLSGVKEVEKQLSLPAIQIYRLFLTARRIAASIAKLPVPMDQTQTEPQARRSGFLECLP